MTTPLPSQGVSLFETLERFRNEAEKGNLAVIKQLTDAYGKINTRLTEQMELEMRRIFADPNKVITRAYLHKRLEALKAQVEDELRRYQSYVATTIDLATDRALLLGAQHSLALMRMVLPRANTALIGINFDKLPTAQVDTMIGFLSPGSTLFNRIEKIAQYHAPRVIDTLVNAMALGSGPRKTAKEIEPLYQEIKDKFGVALANPLADSIRMARTAQLYAYREAAHVNYQANSDVVTGWQWFTSPRGACISCIAMHGSVHDLKQRLNDHYCGRCTALPIVLGQPLISEGASQKMFDRMSEAEQKKAMGPGGYKLYKEGKVTLSQFTRQVNDAVYGKMRTVRPLKDMILARPKPPRTPRAPRAPKVSPEQERVQAIAKQLGYDPAKMKHAGEGYKFTVGNKQMRAGADFNPTTGMIKVYDGALRHSDDVLRGMLAHEVQHAKFDAVMKAASEQFATIGKKVRNLTRKNWPIHADGTLVDKYKDLYKAYDLRNNFIEKNIDLLRKTDGCTSYSRAYWEALEAELSLGKGVTDAKLTRAIDETLAEIARMRTPGSPAWAGDHAPARIWRDLYESVTDLYKETH